MASGDTIFLFFPGSRVSTGTFSVNLLVNYTPNSRFLHRPIRSSFLAFPWPTA